MSAKRYLTLQLETALVMGDKLKQLGWQEVVKTADYDALERETRWAMELVRKTWLGNQNMVAESEYLLACKWLVDHPEPASAAPEGA